MSLKIKVFLFASFIALSFVTIILASYTSAKERIECNMNQHHELIYYSIKSQTTKLLDMMFYDYLNLEPLMTKEHQKVVQTLQQKSSPNINSIIQADDSLLDIAIFDTDFNLKHTTQNKTYTYKTKLLQFLPLQNTPIITMPIYEPTMDSFIGYNISQNTLGTKEMIIITTFEYGSYKDFLTPIIKYIQTHNHIKSSDVIISCQNGFSYSIFDGTEIKNGMQIDPNFLYESQNLNDSYLKKENGDGLHTLSFIDKYHKQNNSLSLFYSALIDQIDYEDALNDLRQELILTIIMGFFFIIASFFFIKNVFITPLQKMQKAITKHLPLEDEKLLNQKDELGTLARNFNQSCIQINNQIVQKNQLLQQQDIFVKDSIHEIRTPLTIITLNNELRDKIHGIDKYSKQIVAATKSLNLAYDDLSFSIEQERDNFEVQTINICQLLKERIDFVEIVAEVANKKINLTTCCDFSVQMSSNELSRLIDNNLSNAIKYAYPNTVIDIYLECDSDYESTLTFSTKGQLIQNKEFIFDRYQREDTAKGGYGLGLNIVKKIADKYHIAIDVESKEGINHFIYHFKKGNKL